MATTMHVAAQLTVEEFLALPYDQDSLILYELVDGEVVTKNRGSVAHQAAVLRVAASLLAWCDAAPGRGRVHLDLTTIPDPRSVLVPDVQWYAPGAGMSHVTDDFGPVGTLVVEVASPSTARYDEFTKLPRFAAAGAEEAWLVDPLALTARILRRADPAVATLDDETRLGTGDTLSSPLLPGFSLALAGLTD